MRWRRPAKIAFIGSHGIRKTTAAHSFASTMQRAGRSVEYGREVVRDNPLGINEAATGEAQLWVLVSQVRQELELVRGAEVLVLDRGVMDNFAYYLRATAGADPYAVEPLVRSWSATYDLVVRLIPDLALRPDGVRSMSDAFRDEIERILDERLADVVHPERTITVPASTIGEAGRVKRPRRARRPGVRRPGTRGGPARAGASVRACVMTVPGTVGAGTASRHVAQ